MANDSNGVMLVVHSDKTVDDQEQKRRVVVRGLLQNKGLADA